MVVDALSVAELIVAVLGILAIVSGVIVWLVRRSTLIATEGYVDDDVQDIKNTLGEMQENIGENRREMQELRALIEGGNSKWEDGVLDYLERNIDRVDEISEDIDEVQRHLNEMNGIDEDD